MTRSSGGGDERAVATTTLRATLAALRLSGGAAAQEMERSLRDQGQLTPLAVYRTEDEGLEVIDGFKRVSAARELGWTELRVRVLDLSPVAAMVALVALNEGHALTELEEAWLCRALYRDHRLTQPDIGQRLGHDKSWVCRRLMLAERLDEQVQTDVRLGLIAVRSAIELARLPRGNQAAGTAVVRQRGLTVAQTARMVQTVLTLPTTEARAQWLSEATGAQAQVFPAAPAPRAKSDAELLMGDIESVTRGAARLQVRLRDKPPRVFEPAITALIGEALAALTPVLTHLGASVARVCAGKDLRDVALE